MTKHATPSNACLPETATQLGVGFVGGIIGGLLGGGSGVFYVPALEKLTRFPRATLHGTAGAANIAVTGVGAATFALAGSAIDLQAGTGLVIGGTIGAVFGARLILRMSETFLRWLFVSILLVTVAKLGLGIIGADPTQGGALLPPALVANLWFTLPVSLLLGFFIGAWSAGLGMGGGLLAVPVLMLLFGTSLVVAEGTSLLMFFPNALVGSYVHARQGTANVPVGMRLNIGALPGACMGALLALSLDARILGAVFATFALTIAIRELYRMAIARQAAANGAASSA